MNKEQIQEALELANGIIDYCGDGYEREATEDSRKRFKELLEIAEQHYHFGEHSPEKIKQRKDEEKKKEREELFKVKRYVCKHCLGNSNKMFTAHGLAMHINAKHEVVFSETFPGILNKYGSYYENDLATYGRNCGESFNKHF